MGTDPDELNMMEQFMIYSYNGFQWDFDADKCCLYEEKYNIPEEQERGFDLTKLPSIVEMKFFRVESKIIP